MIFNENQSQHRRPFPRSLAVLSFAAMLILAGCDNG